MITAMQELIDWIKDRDNDKILLMQQHVIAKGYQLLEKEKEQIVKAYNDAINKMDYFIQPESGRRFRNCIYKELSGRLA